MRALLRLLLHLTAGDPLRFCSQSAGRFQQVEHPLHETTAPWRQCRAVRSCQHISYCCCRAIPLPSERASPLALTHSPPIHALCSPSPSWRSKACAIIHSTPKCPQCSSRLDCWGPILGSDEVVFRVSRESQCDEEEGSERGQPNSEFQRRPQLDEEAGEA